MVFDEIFGAQNEILVGIFLAIGLILVGIFLGNIFAYSLKKILKNIEFKNFIRPSFIGLIIVVIKWSIYIGFFNLALNSLPFPKVTETISRFLVIVPAFTAALVLIGVGFSIAVYLRGVVKDSEIAEWKMLSQYLYYFVLYVFGVYAINLALISVDAMVRNWITIASTTIIVAAATYVIVKKECGKK